MEDVDLSDEEHPTPDGDTNSVEPVAIAVAVEVHIYHQWKPYLVSVFNTGRWRTVGIWLLLSIKGVVRSVMLLLPCCAGRLKTFWCTDLTKVSWWYN